MLRGILLSLLVVSGCGTSRPVSLDGAVDTTNGLVCPTELTECNGKCGQGQCPLGQCLALGPDDPCVYCADLQSDTNNCGSCGNECCPGLTCSAGKCVTACQGTLCQCEPPASDCDHGGGSCNNKCDTANGSYCQAGVCSCSPNMTDCGGVCVNTANDPKNCGKCGCDCGTMPCNNGTCCSCGSTMTDCGGNGCQCFCVDTQSDLNNCGACGNVCDTSGGLTCIAGTCACADNTKTNCGGTCVDTNTDPQNCGSCGNACKQGDACVSGTCPIVCPGAVCAGICVDLQTNVNNCGACGVQCTGGKTCQAGVCTCPSYLPDDCNGTCTTLKIDLNNCGACGCQCPAGIGMLCYSSKCNCMCPTPQVCCGPLVPAPNCPGGSMISAPIYCADTSLDPNNCGACGNVCPTGQTCVGGQCT